MSVLWVQSPCSTESPCAQLSPTLQCCLRAWDMLLPGDKTWKNPRLPWKMQSHLFWGPRTHVRLLPEGSEALRAGGVGVTSPLQTSPPALGALAPQCPGAHQGVCSIRAAWDRKTGTAQGLTRVILGLFLHLREGQDGVNEQASNSRKEQSMLGMTAPRLRLRSLGL